ncbi:MAG: protease modulator HflC [Candidatus Omnitrophica bacterium]|nr:protease modulator HflC [Candidatus Omnitrophota bacterium]
MNKGINVLVGLGILIFVFFASGALYVVDETQQAVITQFGKLIGQPKTEAGLYLKMPFVQKANYFDKRVLEWDGDADQVPTREKRLIWVDITARWRIVDPLMYMQTVRTEPSAQTRLDDIIDASMRAVISSHVLVEAIRDTNRLIDSGEKDLEVEGFSPEIGKTVIEPINFGREKLSRKILARAAKPISEFGIELIGVRIKRINYVQGVQKKVYERMISERKRAAEQFRSEGQGKKAEIEGQMLKELKEIQSEAYRKAQEIKGKADATAIKIYADAYNKDPDFYAFIKTLETYKETMTKDTSLILSTDNEFYQFLETINGQKVSP